jgi:hypothetical protein
MYAELLLPDKNTTFLVSRLLYEKHIYNALDNKMRDVWGAHDVFCEIESGKRIVLGVFSKDDKKFLGCVHGLLNAPVFYGHFLFRRKVDVVKAVLLCETLCKKVYADRDMTLNAFAGVIPESNRAVQITVKKLGYRDSGILDGEYFYSFDQKIPCRLYVKEI